MAVSPYMLTGQRFGRLVVLGLDRAAQGRGALWRCRCDCGNEKTVRTGALNAGLTNSCGCLRREMSAKRLRETKPQTTHGRTRTREYVIWQGMLARCCNPNHAAYRDYGGRGITVADEWRDFDRFFADMGKRPSPNHSLDRINVNGSYSPGNCRWATREEQAANRRDIRRVVLDRMTIEELEAALEEKRRAVFA